MAEDQTVQDYALPAPSLPSCTSVDGASAASYVSLQNQHASDSITIRRPQVQRISRNIIMVAPRADLENVFSLHPEQSQRILGAIGTNNILMHEIQDNMQPNNRRETISEAYIRRLRTFHNWRVPFLAPEVLAEANFCYTGIGDTVRCTVCEGELSNWQSCNEPRQEHFNAFGFFCD